MKSSEPWKYLVKHNGSNMKFNRALHVRLAVELQISGLSKSLKQLGLHPQPSLMKCGHTYDKGWCPNRGRIEEATLHR